MTHLFYVRYEFIIGCNWNVGEKVKVPFDRWGKNQFWISI